MAVCCIMCWKYHSVFVFCLLFCAFVYMYVCVYGSRQCYDVNPPTHPQAQSSHIIQSQIFPKAYHTLLMYKEHKDLIH